jgi:cell division protein FtsB
MTRKITAIFIVTFAISFTLMLSYAGKGGYLHNKALKKEVLALQRATNRLGLEVESLTGQRLELEEGDAIRDAAFKYGYQSAGEQVFYFDIDDEAPLVVDPTYEVHRPAFEGLKMWKILLIAVTISLGVTSLVSAILFRLQKFR